MTTTTTELVRPPQVGDWFRGKVCVAEVVEVYEAKGQSNGVPFVLPMMRLLPVLHREEPWKCSGCGETVRGRALLPGVAEAETYLISQTSPHWTLLTDRQRRRIQDIIAEGERQREEQEEEEPALFDGVAGQRAPKQPKTRAVIAAQG